MRENRGSEIVKELTGLDVPVILDPVFNFNKEQWEKLIPIKKEMDEPYIFAYFLGANPEYRKQVQKLAELTGLCDEAIANHTASVCINTCYVKQAVEYMAGRIPVCCVVGFPLGAMDTASKAFEAKTAIENGAAEVDMVINIGRLKNGEYDAVREDIRAVKQAVGDKVLKVIIETCLLTDDEKRKMCDIVCEAGADYIKTSTGFSTAGANFHDVELMVKGVAGRCKVKAAGGISTVEDMEKFLALGADRLGTSRAVKILNGEQAKGY